MKNIITELNTSKVSANILASCNFEKNKSSTVYEANVWLKKLQIFFLRKFFF